MLLILRMISCLCWLWWLSNLPYSQIVHCFIIVFNYLAIRIFGKRLVNAVNFIGIVSFCVTTFGTMSLNLYKIFTVLH